MKYSRPGLITSGLGGGMGIQTQQIPTTSLRSKKGEVSGKEHLQGN